MIVSTPCRFARTNQSRTWNTGMGSADAVGFFVDQEGVSIFGACIYIGIGSYTYLLELIQEVNFTSTLIVIFISTSSISISSIIQLY